MWKSILNLKWILLQVSFSNRTTTFLSLLTSTLLFLVTSHPHHQLDAFQLYFLNYLKLKTKINTPIALTNEFAKNSQIISNHGYRYKVRFLKHTKHQTPVFCAFSHRQTNTLSFIFPAPFIFIFINSESQRHSSKKHTTTRGNDRGMTQKITPKLCTQQYGSVISIVLQKNFQSMSTHSSTIHKFICTMIALKWHLIMMVSHLPRPRYTMPF